MQIWRAICIKFRMTAPDLILEVWCNLKWHADEKVAGWKAFFNNLTAFLCECVHN